MPSVDLDLNIKNMISLKPRIEIFRQKAKYSIEENFGKAQVVQDLIEAIGIYVPQDECNHKMKYYNKYYDMCTTCGYLTKKP